MAGVATAYHLAVRRGLRDIKLVDEREPLTLTSDKGTEGYRNWFPGPGPQMMRFMNRSIDLIEETRAESAGAFQIHRRGYVMLTSDPDRFAEMVTTAEAISSLGAGPLRRGPQVIGEVPSPSDGGPSLPGGADLIDDPDAIRRRFPFVTDRVRGMVHVRRAGFFDAVAMARWMLERVRSAGVEVVRDRIEAVDITGGRVRGVRLAASGRIDTGRLVLAAGPLMPEAARMIGIELPVFCELHAKLALDDRDGVVPRTAPMMIWNDPVVLEWSDAERRSLEAEPEARALLGPLPAGVHLRPRGSGCELLLIWTYDARPRAAEWPPRYDPHYGEALLRAAAHMVPGLAGHAGRAAAGRVDGGYYCKTPENRPLVGPLPVEGAWVIGALSGFGIMGAHAAADLLCAHLEGDAIPEYAQVFAPSRYSDPEYVESMRGWRGWSGQL